MNKKPKANRSMKKEEKEKYETLLKSNDSSNWTLAIELLRGQKYLSQEGILKWVLEMLIPQVLSPEKNRNGGKCFIDFGPIELVFETTVGGGLGIYDDSMYIGIIYRILKKGKEIFNKEGHGKDDVYTNISRERYIEKCIENLPLIIPELLKYL